MKKKTIKALLITAIVVVVLAVVVAVPNIYLGIIGKEIQRGQASGYEWNAMTPYSEQVTQKLEAGEGDFKILLLTDVHRKNGGTFGAWLGVNYILDFAGERAIDKLVEKTAPSLILVLGDTVCTERNDIELEKFVNRMDEYGIPWAAVFGNHDDEGRADKDKLAEVLGLSEYGLFEYGPEGLHGAGNYVIEITRDGKPAYALFMLDSGSSTEFEANTAGINAAQTEWYEWNMAAFEANVGYKPANMAFFHIPTPAFAEVATYVAGNRYENVCHEDSSDAILRAMLGNNGTHVFAGHDHNNNFIAEYDGMRIGYATKSSYNCYYKSGMTGGTLLTLSADNSVSEKIVLFGDC